MDNIILNTYKIYVYEANEMKAYFCDATTPDAALEAVIAMPNKPTLLKIENLGPVMNNVIYVDFRARKKVA